MRFLHALATVAVAATAAGTAGAQAVMFDYVVKPGDTCDGIALRVYGDAKRIDVLHAANPQLGPVPHHLQPGSVLHLPPDASIAFVRNRVDAFTPQQHPGHAQEALMRGHRVSTYDASGAEVVFATNAVIQLGEDTLVVILGASHMAMSEKPRETDTQLINGSLRLHLGELAGRPATGSVTTPAGHHVDLGAGDAQVSVDHAQATRLAVYSGGGKLTAMKQTVAVPQGFGSKAEKDAAPTPPRPLPPAPEWTEALPAVVFASGAVDVAGRFHPGSGAGPAPARWHVQVSRDASYNDVVVDARVGLDVTRLEARGLAAGTYYARVSAIDADQFEGPSTATSVVVVAPLAVHASAAGGQGGTVELPPGLYCGLDGAPLTATAGPLAIQRGPARHLRCAADAEGHRLTDTVVPAASVGPLRVESSLEVTGPGAGVVHWRIADAAGAPLVGASLVAQPVAGATVRPIEAGPVPGTYAAGVSWPEGAPRLSLHALANGLDPVDAELALPVPPPPPRPRRDFFDVGVLAGGALSTGPHPSTPDLAPSFGAQVGWRHAFEGWSLDVSLRGTWEHADVYGASSSSPHDDLYSLGMPVLFRLGGPAAKWRPYAGLEPALLVDVLHSTYAPVGFGGSGLVGLGWGFAAGNELFLELGYRVTSNFVPDGTENRDAAIGHLGYRLSL